MNRQIDTVIPAPCEELNALAEKFKLEHGPHALVEIRNSIVHPDRKIQLHSIDEYHEAKQLGTWYVELILLNMFGYTGEYACRLSEVQMAGDTELVPWARD